MSHPQSIGLHWFRRDLRVAGNTALKANWKKHQGRVLGLFCFDSLFLSRPDFSHNRFALFLKTLQALKKEMQEMGGDLWVVDALPQDALPRIVSVLRATHPVELVTFSRDYEPFAKERDQKVSQLLKDLHVDVQSFRDHLLVEPLELYKNEPGDFYQVYSPFAKKWFDLLSTDQIQQRIKDQEKGLQYLEQKPSRPLFSLTLRDLPEALQTYPDALDSFVQKNQPHVTIPIPEAGSRVAYEAMKNFRRALKDYKERRDLPFVQGTSRLSLYLKNGSLVSSQIIASWGLESIPYKQEDGPARYLKEIAWREFYYHILYHRSDVEKKSFLTKYENLAWENNSQWFQRWCEGTTGFPIVDAGMRELNTTGWMHNRVRMIVASFLCKDLLIDWRWGENYFMKMLLDGDLAPNNGGWQWAASTGCDPQPYFRVFNPWLQSAKFDPDAEYIKRFVPELRDCTPQQIHNEEGDRGPQYPSPMVQHRLQKDKAIALYKF